VVVGKGESLGSVRKDGDEWGGIVDESGREWAGVIGGAGR